MLDVLRMKPQSLAELAKTGLLERDALERRVEVFVDQVRRAFRTMR